MSAVDMAGPAYCAGAARPITLAARTGDGMHGEYKVPGGKLVVADLAVRDGRIAQAQVSGDFFLEPDSALDAINAALHGLPADAGETLIAGAVRLALEPEVRMYGLTPEGVAAAVRRALDGART